MSKHPAWLDHDQVCFAGRERTAEITACRRADERKGAALAAGPGTHRLQ